MLTIFPVGHFFFKIEDNFIFLLDNCFLSQINKKFFSPGNKSITCSITYLLFIFNKNFGVL